MFWNIIIGIASFALQLILAPKPQNAKPAALEDFDFPVAEEGIEIPVVFGSEWLSAPNVTWYGDLKVEAIKGARRYGFFGPRQVLGHKYYIGMQMGLCHGPADLLKEIWIGDKLAWHKGSAGGRIEIDQPDLFGGQDREGGIEGDIDVCMGAPWQGQNDYLARKLGSTISAFRSVVTIVLRQVYIGTTTYMKPWQYFLKRIHIKSDGTTQWYDATAAVPEGAGFGTETGVELWSTLTTFNHESKLDTNGEWFARVDEGLESPDIGEVGGSLRVWHLPDGANELYTPPSGGMGHYNFSSTCHITEFDEIVLEYAGTIWASGNIFLYFADPANPSGQTQGQINLTLTFATAGITTWTNLNFGFTAGEFHDYLLIKFGPSVYPRNPWMLLHRSGDQWGSVAVHEGSAVGGIYGGTSTISMGPTYAYCQKGYWSVSGISRVRWNGSWAEDEIDLTSLGVVGTTFCVSYCEATNEVLAITGTGIYVLNEDLTALNRSRLESTLPHHISYGTSSKRTWVTGTTFLIHSTNAVTFNQLFEINIITLEIVQTTDLYATQLVNVHDSTDGPMMFNDDVRGIVIGKHYLMQLSYWPYPDAPDMNPAHIIRECLTDATWGMGYNASDIDDDAFAYAADIFYNEYFGLSLKWATESPIEDFVQMIQSHVDAYLYTSRTTGKFVLKAIRNDYVLAALPEITEDDVVEWVDVSRRQPSDANTSVTVKYTDRKNRGKQSSHTFHNDAQVQQSGGVVLATRNYPGISRGDLAARVAQRDQKSLSAGMISGTIQCKRTVESLNPGDAFRLTSARHNLDGEVMRVAEMRYAGGRSNLITVKFVQDVFNLGAEALIDTAQGDWENPTNPPAAVIPRLVWEMPYRELLTMIGPSDTAAMLAADPNSGMLQMAGGRPTPDSIDALVYVDNTQEEIMSFGPAGTLLADIGAFDTVFSLDDDTDLTLIEIGLLAVITTPTLTLAQTEIVRIDAIDGVELTVSRGMLDTIPRSHLEGDWFVAYDDFNVSDSESRAATSNPAVELRTRTGSGVLVAAPSDIIDLDSRAIRPFRPANVEVEGFVEGPVDGTALTEFTTTWSERNRLSEPPGTTPTLAWTDATIPAEAGQTTVIEVLDAAGTTVVTTHAGLTGTSFDVPVASFGSNLAGWIRVGAERDGYREWQAYEILVVVAIGEAIGLAHGTGTAVAFGPDLFPQADGLAHGTSTVIGIGAFTSTGITGDQLYLGPDALYLGTDALYLGFDPLLIYGTPTLTAATGTAYVSFTVTASGGDV